MGERKKGGGIEERGRGTPAIRTPFCSFLRPPPAAKFRLTENRNSLLGSINIQADKQKFPHNEEALGAHYVLIGERIDSKLTRYVIGLPENLLA